MEKELKKVVDYVFKEYIQKMDTNDSGDQCGSYCWDYAKEMIEDIIEQLKPTNFSEASKPLMKYLAENHHPHTKAQVDSGTSELMEGKECFKTSEFIVD